MGGNIIMKQMFFSNTQLTAPFYSILFETSICQFNGSKRSPIMPDEVRDHSFIQNHSRPFRFPAPCWCFFSSVHLTHFLQGSGQRTGMAIAEAWFCVQWPIFVLFLRFVFGLLYGWKIQTWPIIRFLTESVTCWFFYLLVFDRIHDTMCLNKMPRTSSRNIGPQHKKIQQYISLYTWGTFYPCIHQTHLECLLLKS